MNKLLRVIVKSSTTWLYLYLQPHLRILSPCSSLDLGYMLRSFLPLPLFRLFPLPRVPTPCSVPG